MIAVIFLDPDVKYHFKVKSADTDGNIGKADKEFATPAQCYFQSGGSEISMTSAIVTEKLPLPLPELEYGKTIARKKLLPINHYLKPPSIL